MSLVSRSSLVGGCCLMKGKAGSNEYYELTTTLERMLMLMLIHFQGWLREFKKMINGLVLIEAVVVRPTD